MDEAAWMLAGLLAFGWVVVLPIVSLAMASRAQAEAKRAQARVESLARALESLRRTHAAPSPSAPEPRESLHAAPAQLPPVEPRLPVAAPPPEPVPRSAPPIPLAEVLPDPAPPSPRPPAPTSTPASSTPFPRPPAPVRSAERPASAPAESSLEERIALVWFTRMGALALLLGVAYFFKYAVDNEWVGPLGRVAVGAISGVMLLLFGERIRPTARATYVWVVLGLGLAFLFFSAYASYGFYHLVPLPFAFAAIFVVALLGGSLALHHDAEPILVLSLLGSFAAPVLLSTGEDRLGGLAAYLLLVTSLAGCVAARRGFGATVVLAMAGTASLLLGWYVKFFDVRHAAYATPSLRLLPLAVVAVFVVQWLGLYAWIRRRRGPWSSTSVALAALCLGHLGVALLLPDAPLLLGAVLAALALLSVGVLGLEDRRELLGVPLALAFCILAFTVRGQPGDGGLGVLSVLALVSMIYASALLRGRLGSVTPVEPLTLGLVGAAGVGFLVVASLLLVDRHPLELAFAATAVSLAFASLSWTVGAPGVAALAVVVSFVTLSVAAPWTAAGDFRFVGVTALWASTYFLSGSYELVVRRAEASALRLGTVSCAGLGFLVLALPQAGSDWTVRALLLAGVGVADLALGSLLLSREEHRGATVLLGQALGLFAAAAGCYFSGSVITLIWAMLAAVLAVLAARAEDEWWLTGATALFLAAIARLLTVDLPAPAHLRQLYFASRGVSGELLPRGFFNARTVALVGTGMGLLVGGRASARVAQPLFRTCAALFVGAGHLALLVWLTLEAHGFIVNTPPPPAPGASPASFNLFVSSFNAALLRQAPVVSMVTTVVISGYAALLVAIGFGSREKLHRYLGLSFFGVALGKLVLWDVWRLPRVDQMLVLLLVGALLLGASFLYARFGKRLLSLLREGTTGALLLLLAGAAVLTPSTSRAASPRETASDFQWRRELPGVAGPGYVALELEPTVYWHSESALADVRVQGPDGGWVPFFLRPLQASPTSRLHAGTLVDPVRLPGGAARAVVDLGSPGLQHNEARLTLSGTNFIRTTRVEVSDDELHFATLAEGAVVFRVDSRGARSERLVVPYPLSDARYLRVTVEAGTDGHPVGIEGVQVARAAPSGQARVLRELPLVLAPVPASGASGERPTVQSFILDAGASGVPVEQLELSISEPEFERRVEVSSSPDRRAWRPVSSGVLFRAAPSGARRTSVEQVTLNLPPDSARYFRVDIDNGDDAPLQVPRARGRYAPDELVFRASEAGSYWLLLGNPKAPRPVHDLAAVFAREDGVPLQRTTSTGLVKNPMYAPPGASGPARSFSERHGAWVAALLLGVLALLALWTWKLLRQAQAPG